MQMLVSNIDYDDYIGRIAIGRVERGKVKLGMPVAICKKEIKQKHLELQTLYLSRIKKS